VALVSGWGRGTWSEGAWSTPLPIEVTGVQAISNPDPRGASDKRFVAFNTQVVRAIYPNTDVYVDGSFSTTLVNVGDTTTVTVSAASSKTIITSHAVSIAGNPGSLTAAPFSWAGTRFSTRIERSNDSQLLVESVSGFTTVRIYKGNDTSPTFTLTTSPGVPAFANNLFVTYGIQVWSIEADNQIVCASAASNFTTDTDVLYPESTELFGHGATLTSANARNNATGFTITTFRSQLGTTETDTISSTNLSPAVSGRGTQYTLGNYTRSTAAEPFSLRVLGDADGGQTTIAVSPDALATNFTLPDTAEFLAIVAPAEADGKDIRLYSAAGSLLHTATFSQVAGAVAGTPCALYLLDTTLGFTMPAGMQIESDYPCFIVWEDDNPEEDETILYGYGSFDNPIAGSSVIADANVPETGLQAVGGIGGVQVNTDQVLAVTGLSATGAVGTAAFLGTVALVTGLSASGQVGTVAVTADANVPETGLAATGAVGTVAISADASLSVTGVSGSSAVGSVLVSANANVAPTGVSASGQVGVAAVSISVVVFVTGVSGEGLVGQADATGSAAVLLTGVSATGTIGQVTVWGPIVPDPGTTWSEILPSHDATWSEILPSPDATWNEISPSQDATWNEISPSQDATWIEIAA
jgi:hypothetical protein